VGNGQHPLVSFAVHHFVVGGDDLGVIQPLLHPQDGHGQVHVQSFAANQLSRNKTLLHKLKQMDLLHCIKVHGELGGGTLPPAALVAHQQDVGLEFADAGRLHQAFGAVLKTQVVHQRVETLDVVLAQPVVRIVAQSVSRTLRHCALKK
jgi:hypothetical protein